MEEAQLEVQEAPVVQEEEKKKVLTHFQKFYIVMIVAQILLLLTTLSYARSINGFPKFVSYFTYCIYPAMILFCIGSFLLRKINQNFLYAFYAILIVVLLYFIRDVCNSSTTEIYAVLGKALSWSINIIFCLFYVYFFRGTVIIFSENGFKKAAKRFTIMTLVFIILFVLGRIFYYLSTNRTVIRGQVFVRFFLYGSWIFESLYYVYLGVTFILLTIFLYKFDDRILSFARKVAKKK